jgi:hypothetical protein
MTNKFIKIPGHFGRDRLEISIGKNKVKFYAVIDNCGCSFSIDKRELIE